MINLKKRERESRSIVCKVIQCQRENNGMNIYTSIFLGITPDTSLDSQKGPW